MSSEQKQLLQMVADRAMHKAELWFRLAEARKTIRVLTERNERLAAKLERRSRELGRLRAEVERRGGLIRASHTAPTGFAWANGVNDHGGGVWSCEDINCGWVLFAPLPATDEFVAAAHAAHVESLLNPDGGAL